MTYSVRKDLSTNNEDIESFCTEIINTKSENILINTSYRQPAGRYSEFEIYLKQFLYKSKSKKCYLVGDLNRNLLGDKINTKVKDYLYLTFKNFLIPLMNKPTRIPKANATLIHHIATNNSLNTYSSTGIVKSGISDHFPIFLITSAQYLHNIQNKTTIRKREINEKSRQYFTEILNKVNWKHLYSLTGTNLAYEYFLRTFSGLYNHAFPIKEVSVKFLKNVFNPWMTKGMEKSSKKKQKLYDRFLKSKTNENGKKYRIYKSLFKILKEKSKKIYY